MRSAGQAICFESVGVSQRRSEWAQSATSRQAGSSDRDWHSPIRSSEHGHLRGMVAEVVEYMLCDLLLGVLQIWAAEH